VKSIGTRVTVWYALASLLALGCFFRMGRYLIEQHVIHSLDLGISAEFMQLKKRLGPDFATLQPAQLQDRIVPFSPVRFGAEIRRSDGILVYRSANLEDRTIPETAIKYSAFSAAINRLFRPTSFGQEATSTPARRYYNVMMGDLGEMRVGEFLLDGYTLRIIASKEQVRSLLSAYQDVVYWLLALMLVVSGLIGYGLSKVLLRPLRLIQATATHIGSDNLSERIPVGAVKDELSDLARLLNQMFDRLEAAFNQTRRFTAEASHELKTPLSVIRLHAEKFLMEGGLKPAQEEAMQVQLEEIARLNQIIEELLFLSRAEAGAITLQARPQDPAKFIETFSADARVLAESRGIGFRERIIGRGQVNLDPKWLRQVLFNLVSNALKVSPPGAAVTLHSEVEDGTWRVAVEDRGPGVAVDQCERIFERFVRLGENDGGSGLGLTISRSIVQLHRGRIWAEAAGGGTGLRVTFEIPTA